jgi:hypothetical protein
MITVDRHIIGRHPGDQGNHLRDRRHALGLQIGLVAGLAQFLALGIDRACPRFQQDLVDIQANRASQFLFDRLLQHHGLLGLATWRDDHRADHVGRAIERHVKLRDARGAAKPLGQQRAHFRHGESLARDAVERKAKRDGHGHEDQQQQDGLGPALPAGELVPKAVIARHHGGRERDRDEVCDKQRQGPAEHRQVPRRKAIAHHGERRHQRGGDGHADNGLAPAADDGKAAGERGKQGNAQVEQVRARAGNDLGRGACNGEAVTIRAVKATAAKAPIAKASSDRRISAKSNSARLNPNPRIGLINGEISMAPMTTAGDESSNPSIAMPADIIVMKA